MQVQLKIAPTNQSRRKTVAWFVTGREPSVWLSEIARWNVPPTSLTLRPIPTSFANPEPLGVLVTVDRTDVAGIAPDGMIALPFGCIGNRVYLPVEAKIVPPLTDAELIGLLPPDNSDLIWHPAAGFVRCEQSERLAVLDLVQRPQSVASTWDRAVPGIAIRHRLLLIEPTEIPTTDEILRQGGGEIGSQRDSIGNLPPMPGEGLAGQLHQWTKPLRNAWKSLWKRPPAQAPHSGASSQSPAGQAGGAGWLSWLGLAAAPLAAIDGIISKLLPRSTVDQTARLREIDRLLNLLQNDPDAGLKFALPMGGNSGARGVGASGNQLTGRDTNFGLGKLFASGPVDPWDIPPSQQQLLVQRYRELAAREIRMGRHRRAAYIFAELLGDLQGAANTLEAGQHYREAAVLYRERLKRPLDAARCLERGGLLDEAAELYIEHGMMENAADLYYRLERPDEAERLLCNWAGQLAHQGHHLRASGIYHEKLKDVDQALIVLDHGWATNAPEAESCLRQTFHLLGQYARHDDARERIASLRAAQLTSHVATSAVRAISGVATGYVDRTVQRDAADATQVIVARHLPGLARPEATSLLNALRSLAPQDRLLGRDCDRFLTKAKAATLTKPVRRTPGIFHGHKLDLGGGIEWRDAKSNGEMLFAVGNFNNGLLLRRVSWQTTWFSNYQDILWPGVTKDHRVLLEIPNNKSSQIMVHAVEHQPLMVKPFIGNLVGGQTDRAGSPTWATDSMVAFACSDQGINWRVRAVLGNLEVAAFTSAGDEIKNGMIDGGGRDDVIRDLPISICLFGHSILIGMGRFLCQPRFETNSNDETQSPPQTNELEAEVESFHYHHDQRIHCMVALFHAGGVMMPDPFGHLALPLAHGIESPRGVFLADGTFVVAGRKECRAYRFREKALDQIGEIRLASPTVAVTRTNSPAHFAILGEDGSVNVYAIDQ